MHDVISFDDFKKMNMRIGMVKAVQEIEGSDKLIKLIVDFGDEERQAVAGIKKHYSAEDLIGKKFIFLVNLERKTLMGIESQCMILAADDGKGNIVLIQPERDIEVGSALR